MSTQPPPPPGGTPPPPTPPPAPGGGGFTAPPPPVAYPPSGETPPPGGPQGGRPALLAGLIGFGVVVAVGLLLFFLVLKPKPGPAPGPGPVVQPTTPVTNPTTPPSQPASQPPSQPASQPPSSAPPSQPPNNGGGNAGFSIAFCTQKGGNTGCGQTAQHLGPGKWQMPASNGQFIVWLGVTGASPGDTVEIDLLDHSSGQPVVDPATFKLKGGTKCPVSDTEGGECLTYTITNGGRPFPRGAEVETQIKYNGQLIDFGQPETLTFK